MNISRENTLIVDFNVLPVRPDTAKVHQFLEKEVKLQLADVKSIQLHNIRNCVYIEVNDSETAARYQELHNNKHLIYYGDIGFKIPVFVDNGAVPVRVQDLPPAMKHATGIKYLLQYGDVISVTRERWKNFFPGVYNGVRILYMKIKRPIPSFATIGGFQTSISYPGQIKSCRLCLETAHPGQKCLETAKATSGVVTPNQNPAPKPTSSESNNQSLFSNKDFPPIPSQQKQQTAELTPQKEKKSNNRTYHDR